MLVLFDGFLNEFTDYFRCLGRRTSVIGSTSLEICLFSGRHILLKQLAKQLIITEGCGGRISGIQSQELQFTIELALCLIDTGLPVKLGRRGFGLGSFGLFSGKTLVNCD